MLLFTRFVSGRKNTTLRTLCMHWKTYFRCELKKIIKKKLLWNRTLWNRSIVDNVTIWWNSAESRQCAAFRNEIKIDSVSIELWIASRCIEPRRGVRRVTRSHGAWCVKWSTVPGNYMYPIPYRYTYLCTTDAIHRSTANSEQLTHAPHAWISSNPCLHHCRPLYSPFYPLEQHIRSQLL